MAELKEGLVGGALNLYFIYKFLRILTQPFNETDAFKLGIVDEKGKILKKHKKLKTNEEKEAYTIMHRLVWKLKRLLEKISFGKTRLASYAAALWLIKEEKFNGTDEELQESFLSFLETDWENNARILKENYEGDMDKKSYNKLKEGIDIKKASMKDVIKDFQSSDAPQFKGKSDKKKKEMAIAAKLSTEGKLPPHLAKFVDKKGNLKKDAADRVRKGRKERGVKITDRTPKGYGPKEEVEIDEKRKSLKNTKDVGLECQECGKKFRAKLSTLEYGRTKCPKCKSTDLDFQFGEEVEMDEKHGGFHWKKGMKLKPKKVKKLKDLRVYRGPPAQKSRTSSGFSRFSDTSKGYSFLKSKRGKDSGYVGAYNSTKLDGKKINEKEEINEKEVAVQPTVDNLKQIVKDNQNAVFMFKDGKARVDLFSASALMGVYNALKPATRKKFETMIKTKGGFMKSVEFAFKMAKEEVDPHAKVMAKKGDSPEKIKDMHPEITDDELENLFKEEFNIVSTFNSFLTEGRPSLDPDYVPARTQTDAMRAKLLSTQKKLYSVREIENLARKYKVKLMGDPVGGKSWGGDWQIELRNGIHLDYQYGPNSTYIKGWKFDPKAIKSYIGKYANEHETPRDYAPMGGKVLVGGLEAAFEVISEEVELDEANKKVRGKAADEIEKIADKGGADAPALFSLASKLRKGTHSTIGLKLSKQVTSILNKYGIKEEVELDEGWKKGKYTIKDKNGKILGTYNSGGKAQKAMDDLMQKGDYDKLEVSLVEEAPANSVAGGNVNLDPFVKKKRKNAKVQTETFGGKKVFVVSPERFFDSRLGKSRYQRYEKYVGNDKLGEAIRQYGRNNPKESIILKNSGNGAMLYLKYGRK